MSSEAKPDFRDALWDAIRRRVCSVCLDQLDDGRCGLREHECPIELHLPKVIAALAEIHSDRMDEYVAVIEGQICPGCTLRGHTPDCRLRSRAECSLYSYLPYVVEAVEEVTGAQWMPREPSVPFE